MVQCQLYMPRHLKIGTMKKGSNNGGLWWERGKPHPFKGKKLKAEDQYAPKQTYENYYKAHRIFNKESWSRAQQRYRKRLTDKWGVSYRKAAILERNSKDKLM